jgi:ABC-type nitrate/sulfonate/bicarbonate transport system permease component
VIVSTEMLITKAGPSRWYQLDRSRWYDAGLGIGSVIALFVLWAVAAVITNHHHAGLVPTPVQVAKTLANLTTHKFAGHTLPMHVLSSLSRWGLGFVFAIVLGVPLGILFGAIRLVREAVSPIFEFLRYIPPFAWIPPAVLWFGSGQTSQALIVFIAAFPAIVISTQVGASNVDPALLRASRTLGAGALRRLGEVITPISLPGVFAGVRVAASNGWMALIAAELIGGRVGVGFLIAQGEDNGAIDIVMVGMVAIAVTAAILDLVVIALSKRLTRWRKSAA